MFRPYVFAALSGVTVFIVSPTSSYGDQNQLSMREACAIVQRVALMRKLDSEEKELYGECINWKINCINLDLGEFLHSDCPIDGSSVYTESGRGLSSVEADTVDQQRLDIDIEALNEILSQFIKRNDK